MLRSDWLPAQQAPFTTLVTSLLSPSGAVLLLPVQLHCHWLDLCDYVFSLIYIKGYEWIWCPGLCLSDSHMTVTQFYHWDLFVRSWLSLLGAVLFFTCSVALLLTRFVELCSPLISPVKCCYCWCRLKLLCCAGFSLHSLMIASCVKLKWLCYSFYLEIVFCSACICIEHSYDHVEPFTF